MGWVIFLAGMFVGGAVGVFIMCLCIVADSDHRRECARRERRL